MCVCLCCAHDIKCNDNARGNEESEQQEFLNVKNQIYNLKDLMKQNEIKGNSTSSSSIHCTRCVCFFLVTRVFIHSARVCHQNRLNRLTQMALHFARGSLVRFLAYTPQPQYIHVTRKRHCKFTYCIFILVLVLNAATTTTTIIRCCCCYRCRRHHHHPPTLLYRPHWK